MVRWNCTGKYDFSGGGGIVEYKVHVSSRIISKQATIIMILQVIVLCFSVPSAVLTGRSLSRGISTFRWTRARLLHAQGDFAWSNLSLSDKLTFLNPWHITSFTGGELPNGALARGAPFQSSRLTPVNVRRHCAPSPAAHSKDVFVIIGMVLSFRFHATRVTYSMEDLDPDAFFASVGAFLLWLSILKFLEWRAEVSRVDRRSPSRVDPRPLCSGTQSHWTRVSNMHRCERGRSFTC